MIVSILPLAIYVIGPDICMVDGKSAITEDSKTNLPSAKYLGTYHELRVQIQILRWLDVL